MQKLEQRIAELEKSAAPKGVQCIIVRFLTPEDKYKELQAVSSSDGSTVWLREAGESEDEFTDRVERSAAVNPRGVSLVFECNPSDAQITAQ